MLQPQKKKLNPAQKSRALTPRNKSKAPASYDVDWDAVRSVNDNVAVQAVKMFDPTGISSYPDVYYAAKDLSEGKGSWGELGLNILGALPMVGKAKAVFRLGKAVNASKTVKNTVKVAKVAEKLAAKVNKATSLVPLATSANKAKKVVGKTAVQAEKLAKWMSKPITPKSKLTSSKIFDKTDAKNLAVDILDLANVSADAVSVAKQVPGAAKQTVENTKKVVKATEEVTKKVIDKTEKLLETPSPIDKKKVIQYYNTDPKRGEVEKPGQIADVQYVPVSNSIQLEKWKEQKLAYGTGEEGIGDPPTSMFKKPNILQQEYIDPIYSYSERKKLYPGEDEFFKANPNVGGMAAEDQSVIINPYSTLTDEEKQGIKINETARLAMRGGYKRPTFDLTPEQQEYFNTMNNGKPYSTDEQDIRETIIGRILSGDDSAGNVTPEQKKYAEELQSVLERSKDYATGMSGMMKSKIGMGNAFEQPAIKRMSQAMPKTGMTPEGIGTHYMSSVDNYAVPELQDFGGTGLTLVDPDSKSKEAIKFNSPEEAEYFAKHYKEVAPMTNMFGELNSYSYGTNSQGIMKSKMNPRKKYANGSDAKGMNVNNYIISPAQALNDYNIMMAKVEQKAMSNPWLPIVAAVGGAAQSFVGNAGMLTKKPGNFSVTGSAPDTTNPAFQSPIGDRYKQAMGTNSIQADAEVEGGEVYETPQGEVGEFQGPSHAEGGIPLEVVDTPVDNPNNGEVQKETKVYSKELMLKGKSLAERKEARERLIANLEDTASEPLVDQAIKNASKRKMMAIQKEEVADLDFQEKVNNIQQMADTMVAAYGTSMAGLQANPMEESMEYGYGSGMTGVQKYDWGTPINGIQYDENGNPILGFAEGFGVNSDGYTGDQYNQIPITPKINTGKTGAPGFVEDFGLNADYQPEVYGTGDIKNYNTETVKNIQTAIGTVPDGDWGKNSNTALREWQKINRPDLYAGNIKKFGENYGFTQKFMEKGLSSTSAKLMGITTEGYKFNGTLSPEAKVDTSQTGVVLTDKEKEAAEDAAFYTPGQVGTPIASKEAENPPGTMFSRGLEKIGGAGAGLPGIGDAVKLFGNYLGMTSGIKTANEQRATDVTKTNVYKNAGEESQRLLDNAKKGIEISKAQAIVKANTNTRTGRKGARNSARGVNQMRAMDWLYDTALNQQIADISAGAAQQMSGIDVQKSGVAMNADQLKGQGEWQATLANDADKDAYYTALALGRKDFATGMQQSGKDLNSMKENKIVEGLMKQYGTYFSGSNSGVAAKSFEEITGKNKKEEIFLGPDGKTKFKLGKDNKLIQVTT